MPTSLVKAAGAVPWRRTNSQLQVALVHRPRYDDWAWPKGKLDGGEDWTAGAVREVAEEMGVRVALGLPLPAAEYDVRDRNGGRQPKVVRYWAARVVGGSGALAYEVDKVRWARPKDARKLLTYSRDRDQLDAVLEADGDGTLHTWPLIVVRHAKAIPRKAWSDDDWIRPLDGRGTDQADDLIGIIGAYDVHRVVTSSATRCVQTVKPYATAHHLTLQTSRALSEEGYDEDPALLRGHLDRLLGAAVPAALCSHGPVLPDLLGQLAARSHSGHAAAGKMLASLAKSNLVKGEALVCHVRGQGKAARIISVERHLPLR
jgi:8-oxo-(d)GTP phosphatase